MPVRSTMKGADERESARQAWGRLGLTLACALVAAQLMAAAHMALVRHGWCPLDGELIHLDRRARDRAAPDRSQRDPSLRAGSSAPGSEHEHGREHCVLTSFLRSRDAPRSASTWERSPPAVELLSTAADHVPLPANLAPRVVAPKQSPPG